MLVVVVMDARARGDSLWLDMCEIRYRLIASSLLNVQFSVLQCIFPIGRSGLLQELREYK